MFIDEKGIDMPIVDLDLPSGEHKSPEYLEKNPRGQVPTLELDDGTTISESIVICRYLDEVTDAPRLFGEHASDRARISMWERVLELGLFIPAVDYGHHTLPEVRPYFDQCPDWAESLRGGMESTLSMLGEQLGRHEFVAGEAFTVADITGFLGVKYAEVLAGIKPPDGSALAAWAQTVSTRDCARSFHTMIGLIGEFIEAIDQSNLSN
jgi:glutathione S-transferase